MGGRLFGASLLVVGASGVLSACATHERPAEHIRIILVGDSTMATRTGYGDALCQRFKPTVTCINLAKGGRSSASFRAEGLWANVERLLVDKTAFRNTYVLIQFGHNDQPGKAGRSTDLATEFPSNMSHYVDEVRSAGAIPVLVTPLTRRRFQDGVLQSDLKAWADTIRRVATAKGAALLDLNADSAAAVAAMGSAEADTLAEEPPPSATPQQNAGKGGSASAETAAAVRSRFDYTHLGAKGASFFADMVLREMAAALPAILTQVRRSP